MPQLPLSEYLGHNLMVVASKVCLLAVAEGSYFFLCWLIGTGLWQASLKAEDILNSWPDVEVGRILREYGEESNWRSLQNKIVKARLSGGLHSTGQLVDLIKSSTFKEKGEFPSFGCFFYLNRAKFSGFLLFWCHSIIDRTSKCPCMRYKYLLKFKMHTEHVINPFIYVIVFNLKEF